MNAVEIEEAISDLADQPFDTEGFPFAFLEAFGNKETTIRRLKKGSSNASDIEGGILQRNNIHMLVCAEGEVGKAHAKLKDSPATVKAKAKFILATDGETLEAEDIASGDTVACAYNEFPDHLGFFYLWQASRRLSKSARALSTSRRPVALAKPPPLRRQRA